MMYDAKGAGRERHSLRRLSRRPSAFPSSPKLPPRSPDGAARRSIARRRCARRRDARVVESRAATAGCPASSACASCRSSDNRLDAELDIRPELLAPNGYLHAATVIALADTAAGYACLAHLPDGAQNFTTIELKCNFLGTAREGTLACVATPAHLGRTTQVWDCGRHAQGGRREDRAVPLHADDSLAPMTTSPVGRARVRSACATRRLKPRT